jgi:hypothetical protein
VTAKTKTAKDPTGAARQRRYKERQKLWSTCHRIDSRGFDMAINHVLSERLVHLRPLRQ